MTDQPGSSPDNPIDNEADWIAAHIAAFNNPDHKAWPTQRGAPLLLLTTKGAKSGQWRRTALIYGIEGESYLIVASKGGSPIAPGWYFNLIANPEVHVQVEDRKFRATARTATAEEKPAMWRKMAAIWPDYDKYTEKTDRDIPVVVLDPIN
ncbi:MAG: nitroreductase family deazaflavin-dependent oxidoreductase [Cryobacterium sp.]|nr:nitroreductase family deazaflavin-dependent oxidoreductase [Cryobacterium sp.]MBX3089136.1 nitroreductase family deazaflavin-dependent oxidoreductase [Cryobacterium sp.]MBX3117303.1 nitroreductase family deazaflavin-dependent oxidoreductase [Cryobacterium sp.]MCO5294346.1 nitroreductase family deazaflavin-dependent oxidoreductase [Homoserinimonas sp.]